MVWGGVLIAAAALGTPTRNGSNAQGVNLKFLIQDEQQYQDDRIKTTKLCVETRSCTWAKRIYP